MGSLLRTLIGLGVGGSALAPPSIAQKAASPPAFRCDEPRLAAPVPHRTLPAFPPSPPPLYEPLRWTGAERLGVGQLRGAGDNPAEDRLARAIIPVFAEPDSAVWGWIWRGWMVRGHGQPVIAPISTNRLLETD